MATKAVKRKLHLHQSSTQPVTCSPPLPFTLAKRRELAPDLESSKGSSTSLRSDASYPTTAEDDVQLSQAVARAIILIAKFPEAIRQLMAGGHTQSHTGRRRSSKAFRCVEEIEGRTITSSFSKAQDYVNLQAAIYEKAGKVVNNN
uniref:Uncharacterized protein n=1 Tax=Oryza glumipatula TaxID=40148 RepID=A0A0E0ARM6_9ORYZ